MDNKAHFGFPKKTQIKKPMDRSKQVQLTLFALERAEETNLYQFRKVLLITEQPDPLQAELTHIFPNAQIFTIQRHIEFLNTAENQRNSFDLVLILGVNFPQLYLVLSRFKCRYIFLSGPETSIYIREQQNYERLEVGPNEVIYRNKLKFYDVFLPIGPLDIDIAEKSIRNKISYLPGLREIFYCSKNKLSIDAVFIPETSYPFSEESLTALRSERSEKIGWYHAQLKQFYLHTVERATLDFYAAICTDLFFLKLYELFDGNDLPRYMYGAGPTHPPSLAHMQTLHPQLRCFDGRSAVSHHMIFERSILDRLMREVESFSGMPFWQAFISKIDEQHFFGTGTSDYDVYFNYLRLVRRHIVTREPNYLDTGDPAIVGRFQGDFYCDHAYTRGVREK